MLGGKEGEEGSKAGVGAGDGDARDGGEEEGRREGVGQVDDFGGRGSGEAVRWVVKRGRGSGWAGGGGWAFGRMGRVRVRVGVGGVGGCCGGQRVGVGRGSFGVGSLLAIWSGCSSEMSRRGESVEW